MRACLFEKVWEPLTFSDKSTVYLVVKFTNDKICSEKQNVIETMFWMLQHIWYQPSVIYEVKYTALEMRSAGLCLFA